jgi:hypothetical protein
MLSPVVVTFLACGQDELAYPGREQTPPPAPRSRLLADGAARNNTLRQCNALRAVPHPCTCCTRPQPPQGHDAQHRTCSHGPGRNCPCDDIAREGRKPSHAAQEEAEAQQADAELRGMRRAQDQGASPSARLSVGRPGRAIRGNCAQGPTLTFAVRPRPACLHRVRKTPVAVQVFRSRQSHRLCRVSAAQAKA